MLWRRRRGEPSILSTDPAASVSVATVIVNYRTPDLAIECLGALAMQRNETPGLKAIIVDNRSDDGSSEKLAEAVADPAFAHWVEFVPLALNGGFGWGNNQAILRLLRKPDPPEFIHLLNPDTIVKPGAVSSLVSLLRRMPRVGAVGSRLIEPDGHVAGSAFRFPTVAREFVRGSHTLGLGRLLGIAGAVMPQAHAGPVDWVTGASVMFRTQALREAGLFDDGFFLYFEEVELMWRLRRAGWAVWAEPASRVLHIGGAATGLDSGNKAVIRPLPDYWFESRARYFALTGGRARALFANLAWLAGNLFWSVRKLLGSGNRMFDTPGERAGLLGHGLAAQAFDLTHAIVRYDDPLDRDPAWMRNR